MFKRLSGPLPDLLLLRKCGSFGNRTRDLWKCIQELCPPDNRGQINGVGYNVFISIKVEEVRRL
jgi:hypothetical protein